MDNAELMQLTARLRRSFPRHVDVLSVCDEVERLIATALPVISAQKKAELFPDGPKRDRAEYMRNYRRTRRGAGQG